MRHLSFPTDEIVGTLDWLGSWNLTTRVHRSATVDVTESREASSRCVNGH